MCPRAVAGDNADSAALHCTALHCTALHCACLAPEESASAGRQTRRTRPTRPPLPVEEPMSTWMSSHDPTTTGLTERRGRRCDDHNVPRHICPHTRGRRCWDARKRPLWRHGVGFLGCFHRAAHPVMPLTETETQTKTETETAIHRHLELLEQAK